MALQISDGVLGTNELEWVRYVILNDESTEMYEVVLNSDILTIELSDETETNPVITDLVTGTKYTLAISAEVLRFDEYIEPTGSTFDEENNILLKEILAKLAVQGNNWKII